MNSPPAQAEEKSEDNFAAALVGGLTAAAVGYSQGMSEAAAVDFGTSMAQDIGNENLSTQSFEATRFQAANAGKSVAQVNQGLTINNSQNIGNSTKAPVNKASNLNNASGSTDSESYAGRANHSSTSSNGFRELKPTPPVPTITGDCRGNYPQDHLCGRAGSPTWYAENHKNTAIGMARTIAFVEAAEKCRLSGSKKRSPPQTDPSWIVSSSDCQESYGHTTDGTALVYCEIETSAPCRER